METIQPILFWIIALATALCAIATVVAQNIVRSATWLLFTLAGTSGIFFLLGADLVAAVQLLVYVGGTLVLVVFGVMLTAQGPFVNIKTSGADGHKHCICQIGSRAKEDAEVPVQRE